MSGLFNGLKTDAQANVLLHVVKVLVELQEAVAGDAGGKEASIVEPVVTSSADIVEEDDGLPNNKEDIRNLNPPLIQTHFNRPSDHPSPSRLHYFTLTQDPVEKFPFPPPSPQHQLPATSSHFQIKMSLRRDEN